MAGPGPSSMSNFAAFIMNDFREYKRIRMVPDVPDVYELNGTIAKPLEPVFAGYDHERGAFMAATKHSGRRWIYSINEKTGQWIRRIIR